MFIVVSFHTHIQSFSFIICPITRAVSVYNTHFYDSGQDPGIKGGVPVRVNLKILHLPDNEKDDGFAVCLCRSTTRLHASQFPQTRARISPYRAKP